MKLKECLYIIEDHPAILAQVREHILKNDEATLPSYLNKLLKQTQQEKSRAQMSAIKITEALDYVKSYVARNPGMHKKAIENLVAGSYYVGDKAARRLSLEGEFLAELHRHHANLAEMMSAYRPRKLGFEKSLSAQRELVRALYGETTDVDAKAYAKILTKELDDIVDRHTAVGGDITKLETYRIPQHSDPDAVKKAGFDEWFRVIDEALDTAEKTRLARNELKLADDAKVSPQQYKRAMQSTYKSLTTRGASRVSPKPVSSGFRSAVSARHQEHRFFHFKDADSWLNYHDKFGEGTPFSSVMGHVDRMSREIAAMKVLGPHPEMALKYVSDAVISETGDYRMGEFAMKMYQDMMGELDGVTHPVWARRLRDARNIMAATKLGQATISALSDLFFLGNAARLNGVSAVKTYVRFFSMLAPGKEADRKLAGQLGLGMEYSLDKVNQFNRVNTVTGNNWTAKMADFALRMNGLNHWTHAAENAFKMEFMQAIGRMTDTPFANLSKKMRGALERYGITADDWAKLKNASRVEYEGVGYFTPLTANDDDLTAKVLGMLSEEMRYAVPSPNVRVRAWMHQGHASGTVAGEVFRTLGQFKSFPATILINQMGRRLGSGSIMSKLGQVGSMVLYTTVIGAFAYNLKEIAKGRTPLSWDSDEFWINGLVQGGGLGLVGDLLFLDPDRRGSLIEFFAGPTAGEVEDVVLQLAGKTAQDLWNWEDDILKGVVDRVVDKSEDFMPAPLNLPFVKLAVQRGMTDQIHRLTDPKWRTKQIRLRRYLARERNQQFWWEP